jgi:hypothetical protein
MSETVSGACCELCGEDFPVDPEEVREARDRYHKAKYNYLYAGTKLAEGDLPETRTQKLEQALMRLVDVVDQSMSGHLNLSRALSAARKALRGE